MLSYTCLDGEGISVRGCSGEAGVEGIAAVTAVRHLYLTQGSKQKMEHFDA